MVVWAGGWDWLHELDINELQSLACLLGQIHMVG